MIRIAIADGHPLVRVGIKAVVGKQADMHVVGEIPQLPDLAQSYCQLFPDVLVLDLNFPSPGVCMHALAKLLRYHPKARVLVFTTFSSDRLALRVLAMGAAGYLSKSARIVELVAGIRAVSAGQSYVRVGCRSCFGTAESVI
jgi:DNA-binding NarL/FixJ family response regulator